MDGTARAPAPAAAALTFRKPCRMPTEAAPQRGAAPRRRLQALASHCGRCPCAGFTLQPTRSASASASASAPASLREGGDALDFWIFGHPVTMSPSPPLHEAGFGATGRPHRYSTYDTEDASRVAALVRGASGGGGSVTIPLKESILPFVDVLTDDARKIGAVNTLTKLENGSLLGDNTDVRHCNRGGRTCVLMPTPLPARIRGLTCVARSGEASPTASSSAPLLESAPPSWKAVSVWCAAPAARRERRAMPWRGWASRPCCCSTRAHPSAPSPPSLPPSLY